MTFFSERSESGKKELPKSISPDSRASIPKIPIDQSILSLNWTVEEILYVWNQVLLIFRNINSIKDPNVHAESIRVLLDVVDVLLQAEDVPFAHLMDPNSYPRLCLINIFGPWLFEALSLPEYAKFFLILLIGIVFIFTTLYRAFIKGKEIAVEGLCKLIIRNNVEAPSLELLSHFYASIYQVSFRSLSFTIILIFSEFGCLIRDLL